MLALNTRYFMDNLLVSEDIIFAYSNVLHLLLLLLLSPGATTVTSGNSAIEVRRRNSKNKQH